MTLLGPARHWCHCAGVRGVLSEELLRQKLLQHLRMAEAGDTARQRSAQAFILCRAFHEEVVILQKADKSREEQFQLLSFYREAAQQQAGGLLAQDAPSFGAPTAMEPLCTHVSSLRFQAMRC